MCLNAENGCLLCGQMLALIEDCEQRDSEVSDRRHGMPLKVAKGRHCYEILIFLWETTYETLKFDVFCESGP